MLGHWGHMDIQVPFIYQATKVDPKCCSKAQTITIFLKKPISKNKLTINNEILVSLRTSYKSTYNYTQ